MNKIFEYPGQAFISNVKDVEFDYDILTADDPRKPEKPGVDAVLTIRWTGFGSFYQLAFRKSGTLEFTELGETHKTFLEYSGLLNKGDTYGFRFVTIDANGRKTTPAIYGYTIPVVGEEGVTNVRLKRETIAAIRVSWEGEPHKDYVIGYRPAEGPDRPQEWINTKGNSVLIEGLIPRVLYDFIIAKRIGHYFIYYKELLQA